MTSKDRVCAAFEHGAPDKVPIHHIGFCSEVASALLGREAYVGGGIQQWREARALWDGPDAHAEFVERSYRDAADLSDVCHNDMMRLSYWRYPTKPTKRIDDNTFLFEYGDEKDWRVLRFDPPSEQCSITQCSPEAAMTVDDLERQVAANEKALETYEPQESSIAFELRALEEFGAERAIRIGAGGVGIPFKEAGAWFEAMVERPDLVGRHLDAQTEQARRTIEFLAARGFRYIFGGSDFASNEGPMYSPRMFRELMLPRVQQVSEACRRHGVYYLFASDGNLWPVADDLFGASGVHGYFEIDRRAGMGLTELRERFPDLILVGNMSSHTAHLGTREEVVEETTAIMEEARGMTGVIVGVSNYFVPGTPIENVEAMLETIRKLR